MENILYTVTVYTENMVGLLNQITIIFNRRHINIESLTVSQSAIPGIHKFTITVESYEEQISKVVSQIEKRVDVLKAFYFTDKDVIFQEVALYKIPTEALFDNTEIESLVRRYNARIVEVNRNYAVIEMAGHTEETQQLFDDLKKYRVLQFVRSGRIAVTRSSVERLSDFLSVMEARESKIKRECCQ
ncbi:MAG: acetolactate synthase small subunit [Bacteroidales bacterium]|nr:acetolactate synthase small subunit [Bacteroidales bacterium]MDD4771180.1 acetolactate synthase small subunit [Bacteroidales bacterium]HKL91797.1 acetolactate synthase small subunit [Bacteroidales bacterium]